MTGPHAALVDSRGRNNFVLLAVDAAACAGRSGSGDEVVILQAQGQLQVQQFQRFGGQGAFDLGAHFDQSVFGGGPTNPQQPAGDTAARLSRVRAAGEDRIEQIHRIVNLSAEQRAKLRVAMEADVGRLAEEIDGIRAGYVGQKVAVEADGTGQEELQQKFKQLQEHAAECQRMITGAFGPAALLSKVLGDTLDDRQRATYEEAMAARRGGVWKALIGAALAANDGVLGLTQRQHEEVETLLMADVPRLTAESAGRRALGTAVSPVGLVMLRLDQAGDEKLGPLLDPRQRAVVAALAKQVGEPGEVQAQLVAAGILEEIP